MVPCAVRDSLHILDPLLSTRRSGAASSTRSGRQYQKDAGRLPGWARAYRNFGVAFVILYERAHSETSLKPTVKELDYFLWQPRCGGRYW